MAAGDGPVDRVKKSGVKAASPVDLVAIGFSRRESDATDTPARELLQRFGSIAKIADAAFLDINSVTGLEEFEVLRCLALLELGRRSERGGKGELTTIDVPEDAYDLLKHLKREKQEHFVVILLDAKNRVMSHQTVHIGTLTMSVVGPREVFRLAVREGASSIIVGHNHPSGDATPSPEDIEVTRRLVEVGKELDIPVIDHVIIGDPNSVSFSRKGLL